MCFPFSRTSSNDITVNGTVEWRIMKRERKDIGERKVTTFNLPLFSPFLESSHDERWVIMILLEDTHAPTRGQALSQTLPESPQPLFNPPTPPPPPRPPLNQKWWVAGAEHTRYGVIWKPSPGWRSFSKMISFMYPVSSPIPGGELIYGRAGKLGVTSCFFLSDTHTHTQTQLLRKKKEEQAKLFWPYC